MGYVKMGNSGIKTPICNQFSVNRMNIDEKNTPELQSAWVYYYSWMQYISMQYTQQDMVVLLTLANVCSVANMAFIKGVKF